MLTDHDKDGGRLGNSKESHGSKEDVTIFFAKLGNYGSEWELTCPLLFKECLRRFLQSDSSHHAHFKYKSCTFCQSQLTLPQVLLSYEVQPPRLATFPKQLDYRSRADLVFIDPI